MIDVADMPVSLQVAGALAMILAALAQFRRGFQPKGALFVAGLSSMQLVSLLLGLSGAATGFGVASVIVACGLIALKLKWESQRP